MYRRHSELKRLGIASDQTHFIVINSTPWGCDNPKVKLVFIGKPLVATILRNLKLIQAPTKKSRQQ
jgi:hypothetical protein